MSMKLAKFLLSLQDAGETNLGVTGMTLEQATSILKDLEDERSGRDFHIELYSDGSYSVMSRDSWSMCKCVDVKTIFYVTPFRGN